MSYYQSTTDVVSFAWNAEIVCRSCTRRGLLALAGWNDLYLGHEKASVEDVREAAAAEVFPGRRMDELDTNEFPSPVFAGDEGAMEDSCGQCLKRIEDTL